MMNNLMKGDEEEDKKEEEEKKDNKKYLEFFGQFGKNIKMGIIED